MLSYRHIENLEVVGHLDSNFIGCQDSRKSTSLYIFMLARGAILWKSVKHTFVVLSTMKTKFISCFEATLRAKWLRNFITEL
jgi:hypothetical protein